MTFSDRFHLPSTVPCRYTPQLIDLDHKLKPFIPDFIPAVGDIDAFLKVQMGHSKNVSPGDHSSSAVLILPLASLRSIGVPPQVPLTVLRDTVLCVRLLTNHEFSSMCVLHISCEFFLSRT